MTSREEVAGQIRDLGQQLDSLLGNVAELLEDGDEKVDMDEPESWVRPESELFEVARAPGVTAREVIENAAAFGQALRPEAGAELAEPEPRPYLGRVAAGCVFLLEPYRQEWRDLIVVVGCRPDSYFDEASGKMEDCWETRVVMRDPSHLEPMFDPAESVWLSDSRLRRSVSPVPGVGLHET